MIYAVSAVAETPLSIRKGRNNSDASTLDYIPGSALLGSLVNAHHLMRNNSDELDLLLFSDTVRFNNLYPAGLPEIADKAVAMKLELLNDPELPVYPFPGTARSCKRFGGFQHDSPYADEHHGVYDHLLPLAFFEMSQHTQPEILRPHKHCAHKNEQGLVCKEERGPQKQGYYRRGDKPDQWVSFEVKQMLRTHTGISRTTGTVQQSILFSRSVLAAASCFWGTLQVDSEAAAALKQFIEEASQAGLIRVGSNRSRGMGRITVRLSGFEPDTKEKLAGRLQRFNQALKDAAGDYNLDLKYGCYVPLTLTSDAILVDHLLRYQTFLGPDYLAATHQLDGAELVYGHAQPQRIMGWNSLWRLPKADELAIGLGSVFLFGFENTLNDQLVTTLFNLQEAGIGIRRREGYGQLLVANPFHWEANNV